MRAVWLAAVLWTFSGAQALAAAQPEAALEPLRLLSEHPVEGMTGGNLSGLAWCGDALLAVSDREDDRLYRLNVAVAGTWQAQAEYFQAPPAPASGLPWGVRVRNSAVATVRGGALDFEGLACDGAGNRYLVSEAQVGVLRLTPEGRASWLTLPAGLLRQARASGMLLRANALYEGVAVNPAGTTLWLAAERERRGLLVLHRSTSTWRCSGGCILQVEGGLQPSVLAPERRYALDYSDLSWHAGRLFSLERLTHQICRRTPSTGEVERCWSFAQVAAEPGRSYGSPFGNAEALALDKDGAFVGLDNNGRVRADGQALPLVWRLAAPAGGWLAR